VSNKEDQFFSSVSDESKPESDPEQLCQMLEAKLKNERAGWARTKAKVRTMRAGSFALLFLIILGALAAFYVISARLAEHRAAPAPLSSSSSQ
jgi:hypothetical protein